MISFFSSSAKDSPSTVDTDISLGSLSLTAPSPSIRMRLLVPVAVLTLSCPAFANVQSTSIPVGQLNFNNFAPIVTNNAVTTLNIPIGSLTLSGPTIPVRHRASVGVGSLTLTGITPTPKQQSFAVPVLSMNFNSFAPGVESAYNTSPPVVSLGLTALTPGIRQKPSVGLASLGLTPLTPTINYRLPVPVGVMTLTPLTPSYSLPASQESASRLTQHLFSGSQSALVYEPRGVDNNSNNYRAVFFFHGFGEKGQPLNKVDTIGTGNNVQTLFSGILTATQPILGQSIKVLLNDVEVATGRNGVISGSGVSGTFTVTNPGTYTLQFSPAPPAVSIKISYTQNILLKNTYPKILNSGDEPVDFYVFCIQVTAGASFTVATHWDAAVAWAKANYRVDTNRISLISLSYGGNLIQTIIGSRQVENLGLGQHTYAGWIMIAPDGVSVPGPGSTAYTNASNKRKMLITGSSDTGNGIMYSILSNSASADSVLPYESTLWWKATHSESLWTTKCFNRRDRTDAVGTAPFDFFEFFWPLSLDAEEQATDFVTVAEEQETIESYLEANNQVANLSAGPVKTDLEDRLSDVKTSLGSWAIIDFGSASYLSPAPVNSVVSAAPGSISNLLDDTGANTGFGFTIVSPTDAVPTMAADIGSRRLMGQQFGLNRFTTRDGMQISITDIGVLKFTNLNNAHRYTVRCFFGTSSGSYTTPMTTRAEAQVVIGSSTKYLYADLNSTTFMEFTGLEPIANEVTMNVSCRTTADSKKVLYLQALLIKREV